MFWMRQYLCSVYIFHLFFTSSSFKFKPPPSPSAYCLLLRLLLLLPPPPPPPLLLIQVIVVLKIKGLLSNHGVISWASHILSWYQSVQPGYFTAVWLNKVNKTSWNSSTVCLYRYVCNGIDFQFSVWWTETTQIWSTWDLVRKGCQTIRDLVKMTKTGIKNQMANIQGTVKWQEQRPWMCWRILRNIST